MQVILTQDVKGQGKKGQLINVSDGYGRNYLLPRGLAEEANKQNINVMQGKAASAEYHKEQELAEAKKTAGVIATISVELKAKSGANGKLFGSITSTDVAEALKMQHHIKIDKKNFVMSEGIKALGTTEVKVKLPQSVSAMLKVNVVSE